MTRLTPQGKQFDLRIDANTLKITKSDSLSPDALTAKPDVVSSTD
jgi:hypothetical protein